MEQVRGLGLMGQTALFLFGDILDSDCRDKKVLGHVRSKLRGGPGCANEPGTRRRRQGWITQPRKTPRKLIMLWMSRIHPLLFWGQEQEARGPDTLSFG